jgi:hypothetical protein
MCKASLTAGWERGLTSAATQEPIFSLIEVSWTARWLTFQAAFNHFLGFSNIQGTLVKCQIEAILADRTAPSDPGVQCGLNQD